jgi:hypothetical protein
MRFAQSQLRILFAPANRSSSDVWDALGIITMLQREAQLQTSCPCCGEGMTIQVTGGRPLQSTGIIHFALPARG